MLSRPPLRLKSVTKYSIFTSVLLVCNRRFAQLPRSVSMKVVLHAFLEPLRVPGMLPAKLKDARFLKGDEAALHHGVQYWQKRIDLFLRVTDLDDDGRSTSSRERARARKASSWRQRRRNPCLPPRSSQQARQLRHYAR